MINRKPRLQVDSGLQRERLRPQASPVDTFVKPSEGTKAGQLAESLASVSPGLAKYSQVLTDRDKEKQLLRAEMTARELRDDHSRVQEMIKTGELKPHESSWFQRGLSEQLGRSFAEEYNTAWIQHSAREGLGELLDVAEYRAAEQEFRQMFMEQKGLTQGSAFLQNAFGAQSARYMNQHETNFSHTAGQRFAGVMADALHSTIFPMLGRITAADTAEDGWSDEPLAAVRLELERALASGLHPKIANDAVRDAILGAAESSGNSQILDLLNEIDTGYGPLGSTKESVALRREVEDRMVSRADRDWTRERQHEAAARDERVRELQTTIVDGFFEHGFGWKDAEQYLIELSKLDEGLATRLRNLPYHIANTRYPDDPEVLREATIKIQRGELGMGGILRLGLGAQGLQNLVGQLRTREAYDRARAEDSRSGGFTFDSQFQSAYGRIMASWGPDDGMDDERIHLRNEALRGFTDWAQSYRTNPGYNPNDPRWFNDLIEMERTSLDRMKVNSPGLDNNVPRSVNDWERTRVVSEDELGSLVSIIHGANAVEIQQALRYYQVPVARANEFLRKQAEHLGVNLPAPPAPPAPQRDTAAAPQRDTSPTAPQSRSAPNRAPAPSTRAPSRPAPPPEGPPVPADLPARQSRVQVERTRETLLAQKRTFEEWQAHPEKYGARAAGNAAMELRRINQRLVEIDRILQENE
jgi:hypothetical protein